MSFLLVILRKGATDPLIYGPYSTGEKAWGRYQQLKIGDVERVFVYDSHPCAAHKKFEVVFRMESEESACPLTAHQLSILQYVTYTNKEIGKMLVRKISQQTVKNHITNIGLKISLHAKHSVLGRTSLLIYAIKQEWIALGDVECWRGQCSLEEDR